MRSYRVRLKVVSPLHVGTGEVFEPTEFFIHPVQKYLGVLDFERFIEHLSARELKAFFFLCQQGTLESLIKLYQLVEGLSLSLLKQGIEDFVVRRINLGEGVISHYNKVKNLKGESLKKEFNKFTIYRTFFSPNEETPLIPGSAIKGAIRTAVLNRRRNKARGRSWKDYCRPRCDSKQLESEILEYPRNRFHQDPFRLVKVSDFKPVGPAGTKVVYAVNRKKSGAAARGPYQILEVIEPGMVFEGQITILSPERGAKIAHPVTFQEICEALNSFYSRERDREFEELKNMGASPPIFSNGGYPLRIGRHSGAECVTIEGFRHILIRGPKGQKTFKDHATTIWLASDFPHVKGAHGLKPFGWVAFYETGGQSKVADERSSDGKKSQKKSEQVDVTKLTKNPRFKLVVRKK